MRISLLSNHNKVICSLIQFLAFTCLAYGLIFMLYTLNKPRIQESPEPPENLYTHLNNTLLNKNDYQYLLRMEREGKAPDPGALNEFRKYFQLVVDSVPEQADSYGMLGYCQYYLGQKQKAIDAYTSAIRINPLFMGYYYNLGVIYFNQGNYPQAAVLLQKALSSPLQLTVQSLLLSTRVYALLLQELPGRFPDNISQYLADEQQQAALLLQLIIKHKDSPNNLIGKKAALRLI